jgi:cytochrome c-type biogenesis protein CcmH
LALLAALLLPVAGLAAAQSLPASDSLAERARTLEAKLMAPCCFTQTIDQHESEAARQMRAEVRQWLAQGDSEEQILDRYVQLHGARILAVPPQRGFNRLLYWMPYVVTLALLVALCLTLRAWYRSGHATDRPT